MFFFGEKAIFCICLRWRGWKGDCLYWRRCCHGADSEDAIRSWYQ